MWKVLCYTQGGVDPEHVFRSKTKPQALALAVGFLDQEPSEDGRTWLIQLEYEPKPEKVKK